MGGGFARGCTTTLLVVAASCANRAPDPTTTSSTDVTTVPSAFTTTVAETTTAAPLQPVTFGNLESPCAPAPTGTTPRIAEDEAGGSTDVIRLAVPNDKGALSMPGLIIETYDAAVAFADWCNEQGGIVGLPIEIVDADAKLFEVPARMEQICADAFAMVGGGWAFDDQAFPRFHECDMIDFPAYLVSAAKSVSDGMVAPMPNPATTKESGWFAWAMNTHPDDMSSLATLYGDFGVGQDVEKSYVEAAESLGANVVARLPFNPLGEASWIPIAQALKNADAKALTIVGVPEVVALLLKAFDEIAWRPELVLLDNGFYDRKLIESGGPSAEGVVVRSSTALLEEASTVKAVADYLDMMSTHNPEGKVASLGLATTSAFLLFATAARSCIEDNDGLLERSCVLSSARDLRLWDGGGLHAPTDPGSNLPSECFLLVQVRNGGFERLYPDAGFDCSPDFLLTMGERGDLTAGQEP